MGSGNSGPRIPGVLTRSVQLDEEFSNLCRRTCKNVEIQTSAFFNCSQAQGSSIATRDLGPGAGIKGNLDPGNAARLIAREESRQVPDILGLDGLR